jgi:hypothetical protein
MDVVAAQNAHSPARPGAELAGRVVSVRNGGEHPTVGKFIGMLAGKVTIFGLVTEIGEQAAMAPGGSSFRKVARLDLVGEINQLPNGGTNFQRGVTEYPNIGDGAVMLTEDDLRMVYAGSAADHAHVGDLQQNSDIGVHINIE